MSTLFNKLYAEELKRVMEMNMKIRVKYINQKCEIKWNEKGDWVDLRSASNIALPAGAHGVIHLGVAIELPEGYEAIIAPRSSTFKRWGLIQTNGIGIIDHTYCGDNDEWGMPVYATRDTCIMEGDRVCQFRIQKAQPHFSIERVEVLDNADRKGFGSTGRN